MKTQITKTKSKKVNILMKKTIISIKIINFTQNVKKKDINYDEKHINKEKYLIIEIYLFYH